MENRRFIRRGELYFADLGKSTGSVQGGVRPVLIIQNNCGNHYSPTTIVAPLTTKKGKDYLPVHVRLDGCNVLAPGSKVLLEQVRTINQDQLRQYICALYPEELEEVEIALRISLGLGGKEESAK